MEWVQARDPAGRVLALPNQTPGLCEQLGLTRGQVDRALWAIDRAGQRYAGAAAVNRALDELPRWRWLAAPSRSAALARCEARAYAWFARHRGRFVRFGVTPACARPGARCLPQGTAAGVPVARSHQGG